MADSTLPSCFMQFPADFDAQHFWEDSEYAAKEYTESWPSDELVPESVFGE